MSSNRRVKCDIQVIRVIISAVLAYNINACIIRMVFQHDNLPACRCAEWNTFAPCRVFQSILYIGGQACATFAYKSNENEERKLGEHLLSPVHHHHYVNDPQITK